MIYVLCYSYNNVESLIYINSLALLDFGLSLAGIKKMHIDRDKTMVCGLIYIPKDDAQNYPFCWNAELNGPTN